MEYQYESALSKLRWSADSEWSASMTPFECRALLAVLGEKALVIGTVDHRVPPEQLDISEATVTKPRYLSGDPGDEHDG